MSRPSQELGPEQLREIDARGRRPIAERFWEKVDVRGPDECWPWLGAVTRERGAIGIGGNHMTTSHRIAVALSGRSIPAGMMVDHICRNGMCQNPKHLRVVTPGVNTLENNSNPFATNKAKTHCKHGHPFAGDNLRFQFIRSYGKYTRACVACFLRRNGGKSVPKTWLPEAPY